MFLSEANYQIVISNRSKTLEKICWTGFDGLKITFGTQTAHNGKKEISVPIPPKPGVITLTKQADTEEDKLILQWLNKFCNDEIIGESKDTLIVTPKKNCQSKLMADKQLMLYNLSPAGEASFWTVNVANENPGASQNSLQLRYTNSNFFTFSG